MRWRRAASRQTRLARLTCRMPLLNFGVYSSDSRSGGFLFGDFKWTELAGTSDVGTAAKFFAPGAIEVWTDIINSADVLVFFVEGMKSASFDGLVFGEIEVFDG